MTGNEDETQEIVPDLIVERGIEIWLRRLLLDFELVTELLCFRSSSLLRRK